MTQLQSGLRSREWAAPTDLRVRGSLVVLAGRGETPDVYERFSRRISADSYRVVAFSDAFGNEDEVVAEVRSRIASGDLVAPVVIVGSDVGAVAAVDVASSLGPDAAAVILAGYPTADAAAFSGDWETELVERTTCPAHRSVLAADAGVVHGSLAQALDADRVSRDLGSLTQPLLAIHGGADLVSPLDAALPGYAQNRDARVWVVEGAKHDVLNDATHRTTAAIIVQFLETLRTGQKEPIARRVQ